METNFARTFAALSATNEAILYAKSPEELYEKVCEAAFTSGDFMATAVFLLEPGTNMLRLAAGFGDDIKRLRAIDISIVANTPEGSGVCGQAFRDQRLSISNDYLNDTRSLAWRAGAAKEHVGAAAALPLICNGRCVGVLLVTRREVGSLTDPIVSLLERMSANISYALGNFENEIARKSGERAMRRLNRMFGAISATNEAILRAKTEQELYQLVCDAAVHSGKSVATVMLLVEPGSTWLKPVAGTGEIVEFIKQTRFSIDPDNVYGTGVCGDAFRTRKPCVNNDILNSVQGRPWREVGRDRGVVACVAVPLIKVGNSVGVLMFFVSKSWAADDEIIALLARMAENVSFALDNFERAAEKAKVDEQKERGAERDQRSDHAGQVAHRIVRSGLRGRGAWCEVRLHHGCSGRARFGTSSGCRFDRAGRGGDEAIGVRDYGRAPGRTRVDRDSVPYATALRQRRLSGRRTHQAVARQCAPKRGQIISGFAVAQWRSGGGGSADFSFARGRDVHA